MPRRTRHRGQLPARFEPAAEPPAGDDNATVVDASPYVLAETADPHCRETPTRTHSDHPSVGARTPVFSAWDEAPTPVVTSPLLKHEAPTAPRGVRVDDVRASVSDLVTPARKATPRRARAAALAAPTEFDDGAPASAPAGALALPHRFDPTCVDVPQTWHPPLEGEPTATDTPILLTKVTRRGDRIPSSTCGIGAPTEHSAAPGAPAARGPEEPAPGPPPTFTLSNDHLRKRWPRPVRIAATVGAAVLALVIVGGRFGAPRTTERPPSLISDELVVPSEQLRNRREVLPKQFGSPHADPFINVRQGPESPDNERLERRRRRRDDNPEDLRAHKRPRPRSPSKRGGESAPRRRLRIDDVDADETDAPSAAGDAPARPWVSAGTLVKGRLAQKLLLRGRSGTAVIAVDRGQALPKRSKLVGRAQATAEGLVTVSVQTLVLPDGRELRVHAEVQDRRGGTGVQGAITGGEAVADGSVGGDVAEGTAKRTARGVLGDGLLGGAFGDATRSRDRRRSRPRRSRAVVTVPKGTRVRVLFEESVHRPE